MESSMIAWTGIFDDCVDKTPPADPRDVGWGAGYTRLHIASTRQPARRWAFEAAPGPGCSLHMCACRHCMAWCS